MVVTVSSDGGETWSRPGVVVAGSRVDKDARRVVTLAASSKGVVGVMMVDRHAQTGDGCLTVELSASLDGGKTFIPPQRVSSSACGESPNDQRAQQRFPTYGDYFGLVSTPDGQFRLMWPEMRGGTSTLLTTTVAMQ